MIRLTSHARPTPSPPISRSSSKQAAACRHLRSAGDVYLFGRAESETHDDYDKTVYWCLKSLQELRTG